MENKKTRKKGASGGTACLLFQSNIVHLLSHKLSKLFQRTHKYASIHPYETSIMLENRRDHCSVPFCLFTFTVYKTWGKSEKWRAINTREIRHVCRMVFFRFSAGPSSSSSLLSGCYSSSLCTHNKRCQIYVKRRVCLPATVVFFVLLLRLLLSIMYSILG